MERRRLWDEKPSLAYFEIRAGESREKTECFPWECTFFPARTSASGGGGECDGTYDDVQCLPLRVVCVLNFLAR